jgi:hypothetical protein
MQGYIPIFRALTTPVLHDSAASRRKAYVSAWGLSLAHRRLIDLQEVRAKCWGELSLSRAVLNHWQMGGSGFLSPCPLVGLTLGCVWQNWDPVSHGNDLLDVTLFTSFSFLSNFSYSPVTSSYHLPSYLLSCICFKVYLWNNPILNKFLKIQFSF